MPDCCAKLVNWLSCTRAERLRLRVEAELTRKELELAPNTRAQSYLDATDAAIAICDVDKGWRMLHLARRERVGVLSLEELKARVPALLEEAASYKVSSWRSKAVLALLKGWEGVTDVDDLRRRVRESMEKLNEGSDNIYYKLRLTRSQITGAGLMATLLVVVALASAKWANAADGPLAWPLTAYAALFGAMGASLTTLYSLFRQDSDGTIPARLGGILVTQLRPVVGAVAGIAMAAFLQAKILTLGELSPALILCGAFIGGFSEKVVTAAASTKLKAAKEKD